MFAINIENLKTLNIIYLKKTLGLSIVSVSVVMNVKNYFQKRINLNIKKSCFNYQYRRVSENI